MTEIFRYVACRVVSCIYKACRSVMDAVSAPTYEGTLTHYGLSFGQMKIECADELIQALPVKMNRWRTIHLGLDKGVVDAIEKDGVMDDEGKRQQLLYRTLEGAIWSRSNLLPTGT